MSAALGYTFSHEELRRGIYYPLAHVEREAAQLSILHGLRSLLVEGGTALRMKIVEVANPPETTKLQAQLNEKLIKAYGEDGALKVRVVQE
jgi:hypothetical protein